MAKKPSRYVDPQAPLDSNNLPITSYGSVDSSTIPNFSKTYSETPRIADTGSASYVGDQYQHNSLDDANVYQEDIPNLEDERASNQGTIGALGDATASFVGKTVLSTVGNIAGTVYGVASAIGNGEISKIWDNSFVNAVDAGNKKLDDIFHVYKNNDYQDDNILQKLYKHPTQFLDEATDTASFMAGAVLSEIATSGLSADMVVPRALKFMKYLSEGAEASEATSKLTSLATKGITLAGDLGTSIKHLAMGASYEGIVEAKQATMELKEKMERDYLQDHPGEDIPANVQADIEDRISKAGVVTYLANLALVGGTNLLLFPKLFGLGHETAKIAENAIVKDAETGLFRAAKQSHSLVDNIATGLTKPVEESTKFGVQGTISKTAKEFYDRKNDPEAKKDTNDFLNTFAQQLAETYTSKEGWNNIGMGMIIGALGAPGRGILSPLGPDHALGKYGYKDILDENGNKVGSEKLPLWTGGVKGSFVERAEEEHKIGKVVSDLNEHTNFFKAAQANYNTLVENRSLQKEQDGALANNDIFNFQNAKDDQIHSYVSSRIKNNLYEDLLSEVDRMKKLSPDEFYTNFKGEEAANKATNIEKIKYQLDTTNQFLEKAKNTKDAIKIADDVYRGDNDDLREHLVHSIAASKNLDLRENLINQSLADLSDGMVSNLNLRTSNASVESIMEHLKEANPTAYTLNKDKIQQLLQDSEKLRTKRQDYLDVYNHLFTQEGQKQFNDYQKKVQDEAIKKQKAEEKIKVDKEAEDTKKENIEKVVEKAKNAPPVEDVPEEHVLSKEATKKKNASNVNMDDDESLTEEIKHYPNNYLSPNDRKRAEEGLKDIAENGHKNSTGFALNIGANSKTAQIAKSLKTFGEFPITDKESKKATFILKNLDGKDRHDALSDLSKEIAQRFLSEGTKEAPGDTKTSETVTNTPEENKGSTEANIKPIPKENLQKVDDFNINIGTKLYDDNGEYVGTIKEFNVHPDGEHLESIKLEDGRNLTNQEWYDLNVSNQKDKDIPSEDHLDPEETAVVEIEKSKELTTKRELATRDTGLALNDKVENYQETGKQLALVNLDLQRSIGVNIAYLGVDKITIGKLNKETNTVELRTLDIFDNDGNIELNKFVDPKLSSQNHYTVNSELELFVPTFAEMEERGLQQYSETEYNNNIDNLNEYPIAIRGNGKIIGYIPTRSSVERLVNPEFLDQALKDIDNLRNSINQDREASYKTTITSTSPGFIMADKFSVQKSLFDALGGGDRLADKVKLAVVKMDPEEAAYFPPTYKDVYIDNSKTHFKDGTIINDKHLSNGVVYALLPTKVKDSYAVYPMKVNTIGINNARTVVEAIKLFAKKEGLTDAEKKSIDNIGDYNIKDFKALNEFVNKIMYANSGPEASDKTMFQLFKNKLVLSAIEDYVFPLEDIVNKDTVRNKIVDILADRYYSVKLEGLNTTDPYLSYHLNEDTGSIEEKENASYQHYINDNKVLTTNVRGIHIDGNEYAFTAQPVIGLSNTISKNTKEIAAPKEETTPPSDDIEDANVVEETNNKREIETAPIPEEPSEKPARKTRKTTVDPNRIKKGPLNDINPEFIQKGNIKSGDDLMRKCL